MAKLSIFGTCLGLTLIGAAGLSASAQGPAAPHALHVATPASDSSHAEKPKLVVGIGPALGIHKSSSPTGVNDVAIPLKARSLVIVLSGDGGWWGDLDRKLAEKLGEEGYAVIGLDTNKWFQKRRTPDEITAEITNLIKDGRARTGAIDVVLVGYSFGADVLPLAVNRFAPAIAKHLSAIVMIAPSRGVDPQVTLLEQTGVAKPTIDLAPEFTKLPVKKLLCIYGSEQVDESACTTPYLSIAKVVELPGGHHFDGLLDHLADPVIAALAEWAPPK
ncbi:MAG: AcvB/VirJ family lysyl-phosphatidylglycerol hydrolase [Alphaproteobacteria bacterium]